MKTKLYKIKIVRGITKEYCEAKGYKHNDEEDFKEWVWLVAETFKSNEGKKCLCGASIEKGKIYFRVDIITKLPYQFRQDKSFMDNLKPSQNSSCCCSLDCVPHYLSEWRKGEEEFKEWKKEHGVLNG